MKCLNIERAVLIAICLPFAGACQTGTPHTMRTAGSVPPGLMDEQMVLVADTGDGAPTGSATSAPAGSEPTTQPASDSAPYTAPGAAFQNVGVLVALAASGAALGAPGTGKQAAQSRVSSSVGAIGAAGLGAPQPRTLGAVVGQPGLQRGFASGLGFARKQTIFTPRANPLTGPTGRCQDLVRAGFFPNEGACRAFFRR